VAKTKSFHSQNAFLSLSTIRIIAVICPELRHLQVQLDTSTFSPFDAFSESLSHDLETLMMIVGGDPPSDQTSQEYQIQVLHVQLGHMDLTFPRLKSVLVMKPGAMSHLETLKLIDFVRTADGLGGGQQ
jgi:hypothetical protein